MVGEMTMWEYKWGPRAHAEVDKKELLLIMSEVGDHVLSACLLLALLTVEGTAVVVCNDSHLIRCCLSGV